MSDQNMRDEERTGQTISPSVGQSWKELYTAALFEVDEKQVAARIVDAEKAIVLRARELFTKGADTIEEDQALDDALYALRALRSCLPYRTAA
jgi:hypothetical protein